MRETCKLKIKHHQKSKVSVRISENEKYPNGIFRFFNPIDEHVGIVPTVMIHLGPLTLETNQTKEISKLYQIRLKCFIETATV